MARRVAERARLNPELLEIARSNLARCLCQDFFSRKCRLNLSFPTVRLISRAPYFWAAAAEIKITIKIRRGTQKSEMRPGASPPK